MALVYSTEGGRIKPGAEKAQAPASDGIVRIQRQTKGRKGKGVCIITGLDMDETQLKQLTSKLKKACGCGGAVKGSDIEIQGDNREKLKELLEKEGHQVKLAGG